MVETEKVCNHKISTASTTSELVHRTKSVGDDGNNNHHNGDGGNFGRANSIATGNKKSISSVGLKRGDDGEKGVRPLLERSTSAYYVFSSLPQVVHNVRPKTGYRNNVSR